ncbi:MAG: RsmB/NOP family class I SAM-dependent RNA methyltransferase [Spirosomaceae bacterium]|nr:RsmB/NOP family class I SAM-dependent RNA methyltransferase [Spirosomataceae bacterium]
MKLHRSLVEAVIYALQQIFQENRQADKVIEYVLKSNKKWGARDRGFIAENVYEIVRWWRKLNVDGNFPSPSGEGSGMGLFWQVFANWLIINKIELPKWIEFDRINAAKILKNYEEGLKIRKIRESIPDWLDEIGEKELGNNWDAELHALNQQAPVILRTNTLQMSRNQLQDYLSAIGIETETVADLPEALILKKRTNVFSTELFKQGNFEVQDAGSQYIAPFLDVDAGMRVVDACAGAGGKTLHLAALMQNKGRIISMDVEEWKLQELKRRAKRNNVQNVETRLIEPKTIKRMKDSADRLLLDVPCSGLGVLRRNPDAKWKLKPEFIENIKKTQYEILSNYSQILKKGGKMVYATCSILPSESEEQVQRFLKESPNQWKFIDEKRVSPAKDGFDGFYMALLEKL